MANDRADFEVRLIDRVKGPARAATKSVGLLSRMLRRSGKDADVATGRFNDAAGRLREANGRFVQGAGKGGLGGALDIFKGNLLTAAAGKLVGLAGAAASAAGELVRFGQNGRFAFQQLAKHGAEPEELFEHSRELAKRFGLDVIDTTKSYQKFLALQFDPAGADKLIRMGADLRALGADAEGVQGVFMALGQIKGKGRLQGEEMLQLAERGVSTVLIQEEIGKLMGGKDTKAVQKAMQAGKVDAEIGLQAIENAIKRKLGESELGEAGARFADSTIDGILGRFKAFGQDSGLKMLDKVVAPITSALGSGLTSFISFLESPQGAVTIGVIADGLGRAAEFAGKMASAFGGGFGETWDAISQGAGSFLGAFAGGDGALTASLVHELGKGLGQVAAVAVGATIALGALTAGVGLLAGGIWKVGVAILDGFIETWGTALGRVISWWDEMTAVWNDGSKGLLEKAFDLGVNVITGLVKGLWHVATMPVQAIWSIGEKVVDAAKDVFGVHSPSRVAMDIGHNVGLGLAIGTERTERMTATAGASMARSHLDGMGSAYDSGYSTFASPPSFDGPTRGSTYHISLHTEVHGAGGDPNETAELAARAQRRELEAFFRELAME